MIDRKYHIIISDDESSRTRTYLVHGRTIITVIKTAAVGMTLLALVIAFGSWKGVSAVKNNRKLQAELAKLSNQLISQEANQGGLAENLFGDKIEIVITEDMSSSAGVPPRPEAASSRDEDPNGESSSLASSTSAPVENNGEIAANSPEKSTEIEAGEDEKTAAAAEETTQESVAAATGSQERKNTVATIDDSLLEETISKLDARSRLIESVMSKIGIHVQVKEDGKNSGGPYISPKEAYSRRLLNRTNHYINILERLPLGRPISGHITSKFGWRSDPFLKKPALHGGIDIKGKIGDKVEATADGKVIHTGYDKGGYGHYIRISHDNNYESIFGHLSKILVKKGDRVTRKQVIGLVGNSGRSTGPHLHYELRYKGRHINPARYMQVADMVFFLSK